MVRPNPGFQHQLMKFERSKDLEQLRSEFLHGPKFVSVVNHHHDDHALQAAIIEVPRHLLFLSYHTCTLYVNLPHFAIAVAEASVLVVILISALSTNTFSCCCCWWWWWWWKWISTSTIAGHHRSHFGRRNRNQKTQIRSKKES